MGARTEGGVFPHTTGRAFLNFLGEEGDLRIRPALGDDKYERLQHIKDRYDPENLFRLNQNIRPSHSANGN